MFSSNVETNDIFNIIVNAHTRVNENCERILVEYDNELIPAKIEHTKRNTDRVWHGGNTCVEHMLVFTDKAGIEQRILIASDCEDYSRIFDCKMRHIFDANADTRFDYARILLERKRHEDVSLIIYVYDNGSLNNREHGYSLEEICANQSVSLVPSL